MKTKIIILVFLSALVFACAGKGTQEQAENDITSNDEAFEAIWQRLIKRDSISNETCQQFKKMYENLEHEAMSQDIDVTYKVTNYSINGVNYDKLALEGDAALHFYMYDNTLCFANHWRNTDSQSYGAIYDLTVNDIPATKTAYVAKEMKFTWAFANTYNDVRGDAAVTLTNIYTKNTINFTAEIVVLETNEILTFKGYLE
ncbi:MAG: hypothetical protein LBN23_08330 [Paludibacter sp.]|jgi:hypothetical protein|nr:hypothetical protein [Paludibacter sp.]